MAEQAVDWSEWISKEGWAEAHKISLGTIDGYMARYWKKGYEYGVIGRTTYIHKKRANAWIGQQVSSPEAKDLKSQSGKAGGGSTTKSSRVTRMTPLTCPQR